MTLKFKKLREDAKAPFRATPGAAAADLYAAGQSVEIKARGRAIVPTGIAIELPSAEYAAFIFARSGLAVKSGIALSNSVGVIDSDYRGEICVGLINNTDESYTVKSGERIAQLAVMPVVLFDTIEQAELSQTQRGEGGFGSTGRV